MDLIESKISFKETLSAFIFPLRFENEFDLAGGVRDIVNM
jgi:hypothetical protein